MVFLLKVKSCYPKLGAIENSVLLAINQEYIEGNTEVVHLSQGDEIAFIPPISGGKWVAIPRKLAGSN